MNLEIKETGCESNFVKDTNFLQFSNLNIGLSSNMVIYIIKKNFSNQSFETFSLLSDAVTLKNLQIPVQSNL